MISSYLLTHLLLTSGIVAIVYSYDLTLLHTNDVHARIEQTNKNSGECSEDDAKKGKCYGGFARLKTKITELRRANPNSLLLDAGDQFLGTIWFLLFQGAGIANFTNHLGYDAMALGNHEFDTGVLGLLSFLDNVNFQVLSANVRVPTDHPLGRKLASSHVFSVGGEKIGVIGYTTKETKQLSQPGPEVEFDDEIDSLRREVTSLTEQGINKIIAVGHAGFDKDKEIAATVDGIDVVIGGHDNVFLYTGEQPSNEEIEGRYPHVVTNVNGGNVLCVQDYAFGKYIGELHVTFNDRGEVTSWGGNPVLLDSSVAQDADTLAFLEPYRQLVLEESKDIIGRSHVLLQGDRKVCRHEECNLGNVLTDAMVLQNLRFSDSLSWNDVSIAILNSGGIRNSIPKGDISIADATTVLPFSHTVDIVELRGRHLLEAMEHSVRRVQEGDYGEFLQYSGLKVEYDLSYPVGQRVKRARALCTQCSVPQYEDIEPDVVYKIIIPSYLAAGGDGYAVIKNNTIKHHLYGDLDRDIFIGFLSKFSPVTQALEDRIIFTNIKRCTVPSTDTATSQFPSLIPWLALFITSVICT